MLDLHFDCHGRKRFMNDYPLESKNHFLVFAISSIGCYCFPTSWLFYGYNLQVFELIYLFIVNAHDSGVCRCRPYQSSLVGWYSDPVYLSCTCAMILLFGCLSISFHLFETCFTHLPLQNRSCCPFHQVVVKLTSGCDGS